ncbi:glycine dehydrogenase subunit 1 [Elusimicrobium posterum]|uniref:aminomethyl-transferring glycine dehydrogenase subunit GcvPA n=1 Tax=Elusimicrobium posterum TaxID=3116653 RepID=UPI003C765EE6
MFISNSKEQQKQMLKDIGFNSIEELIAAAAPNLPQTKLNLPKALNEQELFDYIKSLGAKNKQHLNFIGAGVYEHFIPSAVNAISTRGEFLTAYTPYQAEASQGTLQAIYEYQSCICALTEMDASNASHYDGATALAEAVGAAVKTKNKNTVIIPQALHPHYKTVLKTYFKNVPEIVFEEVSCLSGQTDISELKTKLAAGTAACVVISNPNFFGVIEDVDAISAAAKEAGALLIANVNPLSLAVLRTPGSYNADFTVAEGQVLGNAMNFGGPLLGIFACKKEHVRSIPGRIVGIAKDKDGERSFVLTLQAREQHIRRERAASNICSNQALCALNAVVYLTLLGPEGLREVAELNLSNAAYLKEEISKLKGFKIKFDKPVFNEFVVECAGDAKMIVANMAKQNIGAGYALGEFGKEFENCILVCATETKTKEQMDKFITLLGGK